jgi:hypothetical protein
MSETEGRLEELMGWRKGAVAAAGVLALAAPVAQAATISLDYTTGPSGGESTMLYTAAHGERNRVTVSDHSLNSQYDRLTVVDRGAHGIRAKHGCTAISRTQASCKVSLSEFFLDLGDGNDTVDLRPSFPRSLCERDKPLLTAARMERFLTVDPGDEGEDPYVGFPEPGSVVSLGSGDDTLRGSCAEERVYDDEGRDTVATGAGSDQVVSVPDGSPDRFDLGTGTDALSYGHKAPVTVDLAAGAAGPATGGERDTMRSAEVAQGGDGADRLAGSARVEGFLAAAGDQVDSGPGPDFVCGVGTASAGDAADIVAPACAAP